MSTTEITASGSFRYLLAQQANPGLTTRRIAMIKNLVGLLAVAATLSVGAPALAKESGARHTPYVTSDWSADRTTGRRPGNFEDTAPTLFDSAARQ
jgi:hypothetical protein